MPLKGKALVIAKEMNNECKTLTCSKTDGKMRESFGIILKGASGQETVLCDTRTDANRVRRVYRQWIKESGWTGWRTLQELANLALQRRGESVAEIIGEFRRMGEENSRLDRELK